MSQIHTKTSGTEPKTSQDWLKGLLGRIGGMRDGLLVAVSVVYLLGYLSWAFYAFSYNLGLVPVIDPQYLAAGIAPTLLLVLFYLLGRKLLQLRKWMKQRLSARQEKWGKSLKVIAAALIVLGFILNHFVSTKVSSPLFFLGVLVFYVSAFLSREKHETFLRYIGLTALWFYSVLGGLLLASFYLTSVFPQIPQEFGGPKPRCVELDISIDKVSKDTANALVGDHIEGKEEAILRSKPLYMILEGGRFALLKISRTEEKVYKILIATIHTTFPSSGCGKKS